MTAEDFDRLAVVVAGDNGADRRGCLQRDPRLDQIVDALLCDASQPDTLVRLIDDEPLAFEDTQRLAHRHAADAEPLGQFRFDDTITGKDAARGCRRHDLVDHRVDERTRAKRLPTLLRWLPVRAASVRREGGLISCSYDCVSPRRATRPKRYHAA